MEEEVIKRLPPHNVEAERAVIGAMMLNADAIMVCSELLTSDEFYQQQYGIIFDALVEMYKESSFKTAYKSQRAGHKRLLHGQPAVRGHFGRYGKKRI